MHGNRLTRAGKLAAAILLLLDLAAGGLPALAADTAGFDKGKAQTGKGEPGKVEGAASADALSQAAAAFRSGPTEVSFGEFVKAFKSYLSEPGRARLDAAALGRAVPDLNDFGARALEAGSARLWTFPKITQAQEAVVVWLETKPGVGKKAAPQVVSRVQSLAVPAGVSLTEAKIIETRPPAPVPARKPGVTGPAAAAAAKVKNGGGRFLILIGSDRNLGSVWLRSYKQEAGAFRENREPLALIPPFLLSNLSGKATFNGSEIVLHVHPAGLPPAADAASGQEKESSTYKLALRLVDGRYALEGKVAEDTPYNAVFQFVQALLSGRVDLAKAWLVDPRLISIPRYLGLSTKTFATPPRIINMSSPPSGAFRYRLITFEKDDLIIDVARSKTLWAIKAIFIAPADPIMHKIVKSLPGTTRPAEPAAAQPALPARTGKE